MAGGTNWAGVNLGYRKNANSGPPNVTFNFDKCNIGTLALLECPLRQAARRKYRAPPLWRLYQPRCQEAEIAGRLRAAEAPWLLSLCGPGAAGKTQLAVWAAEAAAGLGFASVVWLRPECHHSEEEGEEACAELLDLFPGLTAADERCLLVVDDAVDDRVICRLQEVNFLLVTTRDRALADFPPFADRLHRLEVGGLTAPERDGLVSAILQARLPQEALAPVAELCRLLGDLPLGVQTIAGRLKADQRLWTRRPLLAYTTALREEVQASPQRLCEAVPREGLAAETGYGFANVHAAGLGSVLRLEEEERRRFRLLAGVRREEGFAWRAAADLWRASEVDTRQSLRAFADLFLLTADDDEGEEYRLPPLVWDLLHAWSDTEACGGGDL